MNRDEQAIELHKTYHGKLETTSKISVMDKETLSLVYTPGVAAVSYAIAQNKDLANQLTLKGRTIAIVTDGSAVLGLGNIGPEAALPVMEGKAMLFKQFGNLDAFPICLDTQKTGEIVQTVKLLAPTFAGINLEDIAAPRCFEIEDSLMDIGIPVMHDDQAGTAIVVLAAIINATKVAGKSLRDMKVVISGAGAAGMAIARLLSCLFYDQSICIPVKDVILVDSKGIISKDRQDLDHIKQGMALHTNKENLSGDLRTALRGADVFIGVSKGNLLTADDIRHMNDKPIVFAMANPVPEIMPNEARKGGALIIGSGRSDLPNQINNVLAFPGVFKGAVNAHAKKITGNMKLAASMAIASMVENPTAEKIIPSVFEPHLADRVAEAVEKAV
ncbi:MAG: NADP-dependent malic enzyme [Patescibacteria group bacterium]|nr:NADP-dependent malic enzyme [Patescibacteria group bacterium]